MGGRGACVLVLAGVVLALVGASSHADPLADTETSDLVRDRVKGFAAALDAGDEQSIAFAFAAKVKLRNAAFSTKSCRRAFHKQRFVRRKRVVQLARCLYPADARPSTAALFIHAERRAWELRLGTWKLRYERRSGALVIVGVTGL